MLLVTAVCVALGVVLERARRQQRAVSALTEVFADVKLDNDPHVHRASKYLEQIDVHCFHSVVWVILDASSVNDETMVHLESLPHLEVLMLLEQADVSSEGLKHLESLPRLKALILASGQIDDQGLVYIASRSNLEELEIQYQEDITDRGLQQLAALKKLKRLTLWKCGVTQDGVDRLQAALPNCEIDYYP